MIRVTLSEQECQRLVEVMKTTSDARLRTRCQAVLMAHRVRRHSQIAEDLAISVRTLQRWLNAYQRGGLDRLPIRWATGRAAKIPEH